MSNKRKLILIIGPSESGKSTLQRKLVSNYSDSYDEIISATTREKRSGEEDKKDYYFLSLEDFHKTKLIESAKFGDNYYGTPYSEFFKNRKDIVHVIEPYGAYDLVHNKELQEEFSIKIIFMDISQDIIQRLRKNKNDNSRSERDKKDNVRERFLEKGLKSDIVLKDLIDDQYKEIHNWLSDEK